MSPHKTKPLPCILIVHGDHDTRTALFRKLQSSYKVFTTTSTELTHRLCQADVKIDLAIVNWQLNDGSGLELMSDLKSIHKSLKTVFIANDDMSLAVQATKRGADRCVSPAASPDEILDLCDQFLSQSLNGEEAYAHSSIIGTSQEIQNIIQLIQRVSVSDATVLISGESGTGKELVAQAIHQYSHRADHPFVAVNCGAIPKDLLESELFGHVKGAFTNAISNRTGRFKLAEKGSIFFDEIGDMCPSLQVKLLRVFQEKQFEMVGDNKSHSTNVRVIAASNVNLREAVAKGDFREDLFYRLNVIPIHIPALRERKSDIPMLLRHFFDKFNEQQNRSTLVRDEVLEILTRYPWPGNVRELENLVERLIIMSESGVIHVDNLPPIYRGEIEPSAPKVTAPTSMPQQTSLFAPPSPEITGIAIPDEGLDFYSMMEAYERNLILGALRKTGDNRTQAAQLLNLKRTTLVEKIKRITAILEEETAEL